MYQYVLKYLHFMCLCYVFIYVLLRNYVARAGPVHSFPLCCTLLGCDHKNRKAYRNPCLHKDLYEVSRNRFAIFADTPECRGPSKCFELPIGFNLTGFSSKSPASETIPQRPPPAQLDSDQVAQ